MYQINRTEVINSYMNYLEKHFLYDRCETPMLIPWVINERDTLSTSFYTSNRTIITVEVTREQFKDHCKALQFEDDVKELVK